MSKLLRRRPSPAMAVALLSLLLSLTGVSYGVATGFIDSREILDNSVRSRDVRNNDLTGRDVRDNDLTGRDVRDNQLLGRDLRNNDVHGRDIRNESVTSADVSGLQGRDLKPNSLGGAQIHEQGLALVPAATTATIAGSANVANSASSVDGSSFASIDFRAPAGTGPTTILDNFGGLTLRASCAGGTLSITARSSFDNALLHASAQGGEGGAGVGSLYNEDDDFDMAESPPVAVGGGGAPDSTQTTLTYARPGSGAVTATFAAEQQDGLFGQPGTRCAVIGHAQAS